jgi:hypothetical protein
MVAYMTFVASGYGGQGTVIEGRSGRQASPKIVSIRQKRLGQWSFKRLDAGR